MAHICRLYFPSHAKRYSFIEIVLHLEYPRQKGPKIGLLGGSCKSSVGGFPRGIHTDDALPKFAY